MHVWHVCTVVACHDRSTTFPACPAGSRVGPPEGIWAAFGCSSNTKVSTGTQGACVCVCFAAIISQWQCLSKLGRYPAVSVGLVLLVPLEFVSNCDVQVPTIHD